MVPWPIKGFHSSTNAPSSHQKKLVTGARYISSTLFVIFFHTLPLSTNPSLQFELSLEHLHLYTKNKTPHQTGTGLVWDGVKLLSTACQCTMRCLYKITLTTFMRLHKGFVICEYDIVLSCTRSRFCSWMLTFGKLTNMIDYFVTP